jgi:4-hydroxybenzoate polyprenyltransferase
MAFFSLVLYYKTMSVEFFLYGMGLFFVLFAREIYKDIIWMKGDIVYGYESIATNIGEVTSKRIFQVILISSLSIDTVFVWLSQKPEISVMFIVLAVFKVIMMLLIDRHTKPIHRLLQFTILIFILGVAWL